MGSLGGAVERAELLESGRDVEVEGCRQQDSC